MGVKKFIEVRKNRKEDQEIISQWLVTSQTLKIPAIIVYYDQDTAYISASILSLVNSSDSNVEVDTEALDQKFTDLSTSGSYAGLRYWNHNGRFFTFDEIPKEKAPAIATEIFKVIDNAITLNQKKV